MRHPRLAVHVALLIVSVVASAVLVQAQFRAALRGTVTDPQGEVVAGATVTLVNTDTEFAQPGASQCRGMALE